MLQRNSLAWNLPCLHSSVRPYSDLNNECRSLWTYPAFRTSIDGFGLNLMPGIASEEVQHKRLSLCLSRQPCCKSASECFLHVVSSALLFQRIVSLHETSRVVWPNEFLTFFHQPFDSHGRSPRFWASFHPIPHVCLLSAHSPFGFPQLPIYSLLCTFHGRFWCKSLVRPCMPRALKKPAMYFACYSSCKRRRWWTACRVCDMWGCRRQSGILFLSISHPRHALLYVRLKSPTNKK